MENKKLLLDIYDFWFPNEKYKDYWFSCEYDFVIRDKYYDLLKYFENISVKEISLFIDSCKEKRKVFISVIILLDQFSRNIYRKGSFRVNDIKALELSNKYGYLIDELKTNEFVFYCLVYRHNNYNKENYDFLDYVMKLINEKMNSIKSTITKNDIKLFSKLLNNTISNYGRSANTYKIDYYDKIGLLGDVNLNYFDEIIDYIDLDSRKYFINPEHKSKINHEKCERIVKEYLLKYNFKKITLSLSGGVDSMVIFQILYKLRFEGVIDNFVCVHVDYGNRDESIHEMEFVKRWCMIYQVDLLYISLYHVRREHGKIYSKFIDRDIIDDYIPIDRNIYEESTKNIRFDMYNKAKEIYDSEIVLLGHHGDDLSENVLMNAFRTSSVLDLFRMSEVNIIKEVRIGRPLLSLEKSEIYSYSNSNKILYLKDTTTDLCYRGVIRKKVIPALKEIDPHITNSLRMLGSNSDEINIVMKTLVIDPIIESMKIFKHGFSLEINDKYFNFESIISRILLLCFHSNQRRMITKKNLKILIENYKLKKTNIITRLSNGMNAFFHNTNNIYFVDEIIFTKKWSIKVVIEVEDYDLIDDHIKIEDVMNGYFKMKYLRCTDQIYYKKDSLGNGHKDSSNRRFFKNNILSKYIPKKHIGHICNKCKKNRKKSIDKIEKYVFIYETM